MYDKPILAIIRENLNEEGVLPRDFSLPQDPDENSGIPFADGAEDGIACFHTASRPLGDEETDLLIDALNAMVGGHMGTADELFLKLTKSLRACEFAGNLSSLIEENAEIIDPAHAYSYGMHLITMARDKELVKIGLAMHIKAGEEAVRPFRQIITDLAYCNEFTWFCLPIIEKWADGNDRIFEIAKHVYGWGRIHALAYLEPSTYEIRRWVLKEGVHNDVLPDYTAFYAWEKSGAQDLLKGKLSAEDFASIREIMSALLSEEPVLGLSIIKDPKSAVRAFLDQARYFKLGQEDYRVISDIRVRYESGEEKDELIVKLCNDLINGM